MLKNKNTINTALTILIVAFMIGSTIIPTVFADLEDNYHTGFKKGITWKPFVPLKKTTFIQHDDESLLDDYGYLASIPSSVFYNEETDKIYSSPLIFYEEKYISESLKDRTFDARQGIDYFMEDWIAYSKGMLDQMTLINVDENTLDTNWDAKQTFQINQDNPFALAHDIAINDWEYSDSAVLAVIQENYQKPDNKTTGIIENTLEPGNGVRTEHFEVPQTNDV